MKTAKTILLLLILTLFLVSSSQAPVRACDGCQDACAFTYSVCNDNVYNQYQTCMSDCDVYYPWWSGCPVYCMEARDTGWAQCETDYNNCLTGCP